MPTPSNIVALVKRFEDNYASYKSTNYEEKQLQIDFVNVFFASLGWDIANERGWAENVKEVILEDRVRFGEATKKPDYCFRIGGTSAFYVETKQPSVNIHDDPKPAFQLRNYGWHGKLPVCILTDFDELAVYDCRVQPLLNDGPAVARTLFMGFRDYESRWDEIAALFNRDAVARGALDKYAAESGKRRGTTSVDEVFLKDIEHWRSELARVIALRNPTLTQQEMNFAVQATIDRIVFLRICEDRGIEPHQRLATILNGDKTYPRLCELFQRADERYNSGLFHFKVEKDRPESPDEFTLSLKIDDGVLKEIVGSLYAPRSPYDFSIFPADILGQVYERFLGKVIRLTAGHQAKVEEKPDVPKALGAYYTPTYIVQYIVKSTVDKLLVGKTPQQASHLRILDPACGSGSFLIVAYQHILDWHLAYYLSHDPESWAKGKAPRVRQVIWADDGHRSDLPATPVWRLTTDERKRILLNNIQGVDIDAQAVEVTKLSLLLKVLEGESQESISQQYELFHQRALPDLSRNIKCGNSLIGSDFHQQPLLPHLTDEDKDRINVFDWRGKDGFPEIMNDGGFDAVIGNPPYLRIQGLQEYYGHHIPYLIDHYQSAVKRFDFYLLFAEKGFDLLRQGGCLGFICPHKFLNSAFGSGLRRFLVQNSAIDTFISFGQNLVFGRASVYTGILVLKKGGDGSFRYHEIPDVAATELPARLNSLQPNDFATFALADLGPAPWALTSSAGKTVLSRMQRPDTLGQTFRSIFQGVVTGSDDIYFLDNPTLTEGPLVQVFSPRLGANIEIETGILKPMLKGEDLSRYSPPESKRLCIYPYKRVGDNTVIMEEQELSSAYPRAYEYLSTYRAELRQLRIKFKTNPQYWYSCHRGRSMELFEQVRIITPEISLGCNMTIDRGGLYHNTKVYSLLPPSDSTEQFHYWLGVLNSKLMWWFLKNTGYVLRGGYFTFKTKYLEPFPLRRIDFSVLTDRALHDKVATLVERILELHKRLTTTRTPQEKTALDRQIEATDAEIDRLVYELYALREEEIRIVEEASRPPSVIGGSGLGLE
jgi:hypothetical protein